MKSPAPGRNLFAVFFTFFFFSGAAGLIYEVLWMRQFGLVMGNTSLSLSAVLTAFMGGLALGSWIGGRFADRGGNQLLGYGVLEILIGLYALSVPLLISATHPLIAMLYRMNPEGWAMHIGRFTLSLLIMGVPTTFMGATLPLLIRYFTITREEVGRRVGMLYGINTIGAMFGAFMAGFFLIPWAGMWLTNIVAAAINIGVGTMSLMVGGWTGKSEPSKVAPTEVPIETPNENIQAPATATFGGAAVAIALVGIAISGWAAMIYQVCWTRLFALLLGSSTYAFSLILVATIGGLATGGIYFGRLADRIRNPLVLYAALQIATGAATLALSFVTSLLPPIALWLITTMLGSFAALMAIQFIFIAAIIFVPTFLMGGMFPVTARICAPSLDRLGATIGNVYAFNTAGAVIGSFSAGLILMRFFGLGATMLIAMAMNFGVAIVAALPASLPDSTRAPRVRSLVLGLSVFLLTAIILSPPKWEKEVMTSGPFRYYVHNAKGRVQRDSLNSKELKSEMVYYRDDISGTVTVLEDRGPFHEVSLTINGKPDASNAAPDMVTMMLTGHLGMILHPNPKTVMHLGLGGGITLASILRHDSVERLDLVEISPAVVDAVRKHFSEVNLHALDDPRTNLIVADGRNHLALTDQKYDVIVSQPSNPWIAGISNMFTREFFELSAARLNKGGTMCVWIHLYNMDFDDFMTVLKTFSETMPYVTLWGANDADFLMVGSNDPIKVDWPLFQSRIESNPKVRDHLEQGRIGDARRFITHYIASKEDYSKLDAYLAAPINVDDTCRLEFSAPKAYYKGTDREKLSRMFELQESPARLFTENSIPPDIKTWMERIPPARRLVRKAIEKSIGGDPSGIERDLTSALELNPWDYPARIHLYQYYWDLALIAYEKKDYFSAFGWVGRAIETYEFLGLAYDRWEVANMYNLSRILAVGRGAPEVSERSKQKLLDMGGDKLFEVMSEDDDKKPL